MVNDAIPIIALLLLACNNSTLTLTKITLIWNLIQNIYSICFVQKIIFELSISEIIISWDYCLLVCQLILIHLYHQTPKYLIESSHIDCYWDWHFFCTPLYWNHITIHEVIGCCVFDIPRLMAKHFINLSNIIWEMHNISKE